MKRLEITLIVLSVIGLSMLFFHLDLSAVITIISINLLILLYFIFSIPLFNGVGFKFKSLSDIGPGKIIIPFVLGNSLAIALMGLVFMAMSWVGGRLFLRVGTFGLIIIVLSSLIFLLLTKQKVYRTTLIYSLIYGIISAIVLFTPREDWLEFRYADHPEYIEATKAHWADPENEELKIKMEEEQEKMLDAQ